MALARCLSINFSFKCPSCFSALRGCFKSSDVENLQEVEPKSLSDSSNGDWVSAAADDDDVLLDTNSSDSPTLLVPGSFFSSTPNLEDQNSGPTWINPVMVEYPQSVNLTKEPDKADTSQNLTTYNAPVRINSKENDCGHIEIQSIPVQKTDEKMSKLATSHMKKFSELMSLCEANVGDCEAKLLTPMPQVDESPSNDDSKYEAMDPIFTTIDVKNFLAEVVVLNLPIKIEEGVLGGVNIPDKTLSSRMPAPTEEEVLGEDLYDSRRSVPKVLPFRIVSQERENLGIILPVGGLYSSTEGSFPASPKPPLSESSFSGLIQPLPKLGEGETTIPKFNSLLGERSAVTIRVAPDDVRKKGDEIKSPDGLFGYEEIGDEELEGWGKIGISLAQPQPQPQPHPQSSALAWSSSVFEKFFEDIAIQTNPSAFFTKLNEYVSSFENDIKGIFPSPAPSSPRAEPNNEISNVK